MPVGVFAAPVDMAVRPGEDAYYVVQKVGLIHAVRAGIPDPVPVVAALIRPTLRPTTHTQAR